MGTVIDAIDHPARRYHQLQQAAVHRLKLRHAEQAPTEAGLTLPPSALWSIAPAAPGEATATETRLYISQPRPPLGNAPAEKRLAFLFLPDGRVLTNASYAGGVVETPAAALMNTVLLKLELGKWYAGRYQIELTANHGKDEYELGDQFGQLVAFRCHYVGLQRHNLRP